LRSFNAGTASPRTRSAEGDGAAVSRLRKSFEWTKYLTPRRKRVLPQENGQSTPSVIRRAAFSFSDDDHDRPIVPFIVNRIRCISFVNALPLEVELENVQRRLKAYTDSLVFLGSLKDRTKLLRKLSCHYGFVAHLYLTFSSRTSLCADQWGMDEECEYVRSSYLVKDEPSWAQLEDRLDILIGRDVNHCREAAIDDLEILEFATTVTEEEKVSRLLYLLQRDILGSRLGALIMEKMLLRDAFYQHKANYPSYALQFVCRAATQRQLIVFAVLGVLFGVSMVGYLLYFALAATAQRQRGWVSSFILWLVLDFVLVSTCEALLTNVAIPSAVKADLDAVKMHLAEITRNAANDAAVTALVPASVAHSGVSLYRLSVGRLKATTVLFIEVVFEFC
jgi:hypothetical protein